MMKQFWTYTLADGRRVLAMATPGRCDPIIGYSVVVAILGVA